jgi:mono/diheme cytochrome c family protein
VKPHIIAATLLAVIVGCSAAPRLPPSGALTFATHCAACHGEFGAGDGPVAETLNVAVPDLSTLTVRYGQFPADAVASRIDGRNMPSAHGSGAMPVWGSVFDVTASIVPGAQSSQQRIDALIAFLRELQATER